MAVDTYYNNVSLLLHCNGADTSTTFTDNAPTPKTVTANGNAQIDTADSKFGGASALFDGTGDYLSVSSTSDFSFGTGDYTIEGWVKPTSATGSDVIMDFRTSTTAQYSVGLFRNTGGFLGLFLNGSYVIQSASTMSVAWHHFALCRSSGTTRLFVDGSQVGTSYTDANNYVASPPLRIGAAVDGGAGFNGRLDDLRITKGVARYTTTFTAPTEAFPDSGAESNFMPYSRSKGVNDIYNYVLPINFLYF